MPVVSAPETPGDGGWGRKNTVPLHEKLTPAWQERLPCIADGGDCRAPPIGILDASQHLRRPSPCPEPLLML